MRFKWFIDSGTRRMRAASALVLLASLLNWGILSRAAIEPRQAPQQDQQEKKVPPAPPKDQEKSPPTKVSPPAKTPEADKQNPAKEPAAPTPPVPGAAPQTTKVMTPFGPMEFQAPAPGAQTAPIQNPPEPPKQEPGAQTSPAGSKTEATGESAVVLNLENADLYQVLRIIGTELKINYVVDPAVKGTVSISTAGSVSRADLFSLLESILQLNGALMVKTDGYYRVMPVADAKHAPMDPNSVKGPEGTATAENGLTLQVVPMRYVSAAEMGRVLTPFVSPAGQLVVQEPGNMLLIVETPEKLKQMQEMIDIFDSQVFSRQRVRLFPIANNLAKNLIPELQSIFAGYGLAATSSAIRFVPLERINAILAISPAPDVFHDVEEWVHKLDQPAREIGMRNTVYKVQNAKASELRDILNQLYGNAPGQSPSQALSTDAANPTAAPKPVEAPFPGRDLGSQMRVQGELRIISDDKNNALIIQATPHDYEVLEQTIKDLDVLPRQVLIDAKIYQVTLSGDLSLGISAFLDRISTLAATAPLTTTASFSAGQTGGTFQTSTFSILSNTKALQAFLTADENRTRVQTLSAPSILVTDNTSAKIEVGSEVPVPTGSSLTPVQSGGNSLFAQTIQFRDVGVILTVTPRINASGIVTLAITQEVSAAVPNTTSQIVAPVINKSAFQTSVVLHDGEPLALGGIITTSNTLTRTRVPLLGDIPGVGMLFGSTSRNTSREELVLLITPRVVQDVKQATAATDEYTDRMRLLKQMIQKEK